MEEVIHYLELKNKYYEKFFTLTSKFLRQINKDEWEGTELLLDNRERILNIIRSFDHKVAHLFGQIDVDDQRLEAYRPRVKRLLNDRAAWVGKIVALDLELMSRIEEVKSETIRELKRTVETAQQLTSFEDHAGPARSEKKPREV